MPCVISVQARSTQVTSPPFLNLFPFAEEITTGLLDFDSITLGVGCAPSEREAALAKPAPTVARTKLRRFIFIISSLVRPN